MSRTVSSVRMTTRLDAHRVRFRDNTYLAQENETIDTGRKEGLMLQALANNWWAFLIRGIFALLFGLAAFTWPGVTLAVLVLMFGAYALVDGVFALVCAFAGRPENDRWWVVSLRQQCVT